MTERHSPSSSNNSFSESQRTQTAFEREAQTDDVATSSRVMIWTFAPNGKCRSVSRDWLELRGRSLDQERGDGWIQGLHPDDRHECIQVLHSAFLGRQAFRTYFRVMRANGSYTWIAAHGVPQFLNNGRFLGYSGELKEIQAPAPGNSSSFGNRPPQNLRQVLRQMVVHQHGDPVRQAPTQKKLSPGPHGVSRDGLLQCLNATTTPILVLDAEGRAIFCNTAVRCFAARHAARLTADLHGGFPQQGDPELLDAPVVRAWLDSDWTSDPQDIRINGHSLDHGCTAFTFIENSTEDQTPALGQAILHDLLNVATGMQVLVDLLLGQRISRRERDECMGLLSISLNLLLSEIEKHRSLHEAAQSEAALLHTSATGT